MRFFNLDLHVSVIADIKQIFNNLGHEVTNWSISGANWVFKQDTAQVDVVNQNTFPHLDQDMCNRFYERYKDDLSQYDAFICTYTPTFAWLYEKFNKPIIMDAPIRYELPFTNKPDLWNAFNEFLVRGIDSKQIVALGNNLLDKKYGEYFTDREWLHIPSLCEYTNAKYTGQHQQSLYSSRFKQYSHYLGGSWIDNLVNKENALRSGYNWNELTEFKSIVHIPYNVSTMTIFENYTSNMPLLFPSKTLMKQLITNHPTEVLCETTWTQTWNLEPKSPIKPGPNDPNNFADVDNFMKWVEYADFYDTEWMPHITYFDSFEQLRDTLSTLHARDISEHMKTANVTRREKVYNLWNNVIQGIK